MTVNKFFQDSKKIGLAGEGVDFIFVSLDFKGQSLENVREVTQQDEDYHHDPRTSNGNFLGLHHNKFWRSKAFICCIMLFVYLQGVRASFGPIWIFFKNHLIFYHFLYILGYILDYDFHNFWCFSDHIFTNFLFDFGHCCTYFNPLFNQVWLFLTNF